MHRGRTAARRARASALFPVHANSISYRGIHTPPPAHLFSVSLVFEGQRNPGSHFANLRKSNNCRTGGFSVLPEPMEELESNTNPTEFVFSPSFCSNECCRKITLSFGPKGLVGRHHPIFHQYSIGPLQGFQIPIGLGRQARVRRQPSARLDAFGRAIPCGRRSVDGA